ncbi:unnamed protein product [Chrysoparadoxa australica]
MVVFYDPHALIMAILVGVVGLLTTYHFKHDFYDWETQDVGYPLAAMVYIYIRNARFLRKKEEEDVEPAAGNENEEDDEEEEAVVKVKAASLEGLQVCAGLKTPARSENVKATVVLFWGTWCPACRKSLPSVISLAKRYRSQEVRVLAVSSENEETVHEYINGLKKEQHISYIGNGAKLSQAYQLACNVTEIPHAYIVGTNSGDIEWHGHPARLEAALADFLDDLEEEEEGGES